MRNGEAFFHPLWAPLNLVTLDLHSPLSPPHSSSFSGKPSLWGSRDGPAWPVFIDIMIIELTGLTGHLMKTQLLPSKFVLRTSFELLDPAVPEI